MPAEGARPGRLERGILAFWAAWFSLVLASNAADAMREIGALPPGWSFASGNLALVRDVVAIHGLGAAGAGLLFAGVLAWQLAAAALFWRAACLGWRGAAPAIRAAFAAGLGFSAALLLADEVFLVHRTAELAPTHWGIGIAQLASFLAVRRAGGPAPGGAANAATRPR